MKYKLGEIFEVGSGGTPSKSHPEYYGGSIPWIKTGDLKCEYLYGAEDYITEEGVNNSSAKMYTPDTVLIAMYGATIGATSILKIDACTNQACAAFKKSEKVIPEYLYYFFKSQKERFVKDGVGGAQPNISAGYLKNVEMEVPTLERQVEIVDILDKVNRVIEQRRTELEELDNLIKSRFVEMFGNPEKNEKGWQTCRLGDECIVINGRAYKAEELLDEGKYRVLRVGNFFTNDSWYYSNLELDQDKYCEDGDLLFAWSASFGPRIWHGEKVIYHYHIWKLIGYEGCLNKVFFVELLNYNCDVMKRGTHGSTMLHFTKSQMEDQRLILPPIELQKEYADFVAQVTKLKFEVQKSLDETQILMDSLMQQYFG